MFLVPQIKRPFGFLNNYTPFIYPYPVKRPSWLKKKIKVRRKGAKKKFAHSVRSAMHDAIVHENVTGIYELLNSGDKLCTADGYNCFFVACSCKKWNILKKLLEYNLHGLSCYGPNGQTLLMYEVDNLENFKYLLQLGANVKQESKFGLNVLNLAIRANCDIEVLETILKAGPVYLLHPSCIREVFEVLLEVGGPMSIGSKHYEMVKKHLEEEVEKEEANVNIRRGERHCQYIYRRFQEAHNTVQSLAQLCRNEVRQLCSPSHELPGRLAALVPPGCGLPEFLTMQK
ncbi:hypothetical protein B566_EDAN009999 [Ephemera danica]|nr:hypothetical protein B566_EDAN009999 [Ephemera danica]